MLTPEAHERGSSATCWMDRMRSEARMRWRIAVVALVLAAALIAGCSARPAGRPEDQNLGVRARRLARCRAPVRPANRIYPFRRRACSSQATCGRHSIINVGTSTVFAPGSTCRPSIQPGTRLSAGTRPLAWPAIVCGVRPDAARARRDRQAAAWFELPTPALYAATRTNRRDCATRTLPTMTMEAR